MASALEPIRLGPQPNAARPRRPGPPDFAHPSEELFASLLSFYRVAWQYEPTTFPLAWDGEGHISLAFSPDFYLPDYDLYIELATRKQGEMALKHRKIRRLRALYPEVRIKLVNRRAFEGLLYKFGFEAQAGCLVGQVSTGEARNPAGHA
mgnify:CR=1 FL=1|jgi:hypothetical protein